MDPKSAFEDRAKSREERRKFDPLGDQTEVAIGAFLREAAIGDEVAIRNPHGGGLVYRLTTIVDIVGSRLYTAHQGDFGGVAWFRKSGKNCRSSGGQTHLAIPTPEIRDFVARHGPIGIMGAFASVPTGEPEVKLARLSRSGSP